ncbi:MAG: threonyl-tRNA synthetase, threonyl-tRNA synthetase [Chloroflexi bacterium CSP1-4]|nr:MAG: threonyl-tRNA synthetase, threonyl-tRNA synthetase [Chloroflexi bacterium CSP1-4]
MAEAQGQAPPDEEVLVAPERGSVEELLDASAGDPLDPMRHSAAHVMAEAVMDLFPGTKLGIGPAIADGFYYDFELPRALTPDDLAAIEARMAASVAADHAFVRHELPPEEGRAFFVERGQPYKVEILDDLGVAARAAGRPMPPVTTYEHGPFIDLCRGPHVASTGRIGPFRLLSVAGAYWRGDEKRPMLQRIYGTVWATQEELERYLWRREEAKKRDHRKLGRDLDLFSFHAESPAAPFWHPRGMALWRALEAWSRQVRLEGGFVEVRTPAVVRKELWETSGHWALYRENMFVFEDGDHLSGLKPMNCPESMLIFRTQVRSYRDLPMRLADYSWLFRNERTGALAGMFRVRQLTQDDSHVICRDDQVIEEVNLALRLVRRQYGPFGFEPRFKLATRPEKKLGTDEFWEMAEGKLAEALHGAGIAYAVDSGGGAFYAPKIDVFVEDALGREWQMATIQLDYQLPQRFELEYRAAAGGVERPVVIHYAIYGSFERFIGIITEHYAGAFPFWCAPVQAVVVPIADRHLDAAGELAGVLRARGLRVEVDNSSNRMQNKIRLAQEQKVPYMLVFGDREAEARTASPRTRGGEQQPAVGWEELAERLAEEAAARRPD